MAVSLGILGLGSRSTSWYIEQLNDAWRHARGGDATMPFLLLNADFNRYNPFLPDQYDALLPVLEEDLRAFEHYGVERLLIPNITLHQSLDQLTPERPFTIIHPLDLGGRLLETGRPVLLLGTRHTMTGTYFQKGWPSHEIHYPEPADQDFVDALRQTAYQKEPDERVTEAFAHRVIRWSADYQVVLACTELSLVHQRFSVEGVTDLATLQIQEALRHVLKEED